MIIIIVNTKRSVYLSEHTDKHTDTTALRRLPVSARLRLYILERDRFVNKFTMLSYADSRILNILHKFESLALIKD